MLLLCPKGQENNAFYHCLFLNMLSGELLPGADRRWAPGQTPLPHTTASCMAHDVEAAVAAVSVPVLAAVSPAGADSEAEQAIASERRSRTWWQQAAGDQHCVTRGAAQDGIRPLLRPFLLWWQGQAV